MGHALGKNAVERLPLQMGISFRLEDYVVPSRRRPLWIFPDS